MRQSQGSTLTSAKELFNRPLVPGALLEVPVEVAHYAKWIYVMVGVDEGAGTVYSLRRPAFKLRPGYTLRQVELRESDGALDGFASVEDAVNKEEKQLLLALSHSLQQPSASMSVSSSTTATAFSGLPTSWDRLAVAKLRGWNLIMSIPKKQGAKMHYDYVRITQLLPVPGVCKTLVMARAQPQAAPSGLVYSEPQHARSPCARGAVMPCATVHVSGHHADFCQACPA